MGKEVKRYVIVTPFESKDVIAAILAVAHFDVHVLHTNSGVAVYHELTEPVYDEWDIRNITGPDAADEDMSPSDNGSAVAAYLSRLSKYGVVELEADLGDDVGIEAGVSGLVRARRFLNGQEGEQIPAGLLLDALDPAIEHLVLGDADLSDAVLSGSLSASDVETLAFHGKHHGDGSNEHHTSREQNPGERDSHDSRNSRRHDQHEQDAESEKKIDTKTDSDGADNADKKRDSGAATDGQTPENKKRRFRFGRR
ncbi:MAG: hypothetical protein SPI12_04675 [Actinomycetaceae bacterium]|nr:hypothetical protein [Actinomycetaceae bacterium]MDY6083140.1 hypothetical protein [Actinomycetaceae bacterium]